MRLQSKRGQDPSQNSRQQSSDGQRQYPGWKKRTVHIDLRITARGEQSTDPESQDRRHPGGESADIKAISWSGDHWRKMSSQNLLGEMNRQWLSLGVSLGGFL